MGQFSWLDCITEEQIYCEDFRDIFVLIPEDFGGGHLYERCYDGYGHFGGIDIYVLTAVLNRCPHDEKVTDIYDHIEYAIWKYGEDYLRDLGIDIACYDEDNEILEYPIKITHDENAIYEDCKPSKSDPNQGWRM